MCKNIFGRNIYVRSKFSCVRSSHDLCARTHAHISEGTLGRTPNEKHCSRAITIQERKTIKTEFTAEADAFTLPVALTLARPRQCAQSLRPFSPTYGRSGSSPAKNKQH